MFDNVVCVNTTTAKSSSHSDIEILRSQCTASDRVIAQVRSKYPELTLSTILRNLITCENNVEETAKCLEARNVWAQMTFPLSSVCYSQAIPGKCFLYAHGTDTTGHPLVIFNASLHNPASRNIEECCRWVTYMFEVALARLPSDKVMFSILWNRSNLGFSTDIEFGRRVKSILDNYYPNRVHNLIFYPISRSLKSLWGIVKGVLRRSYSKVRLARNIDQLRTYIPDKFIPVNIGGSCSYQFDMIDYPSPHTDTYLSMEASMNGEAVDDETLLNDMYMPESTDELDIRCMNQASVGCRFVNMRTYSNIVHEPSAADIDAEANMVFTALEAGPSDVDT